MGKRKSQWTKHWPYSQAATHAGCAYPDHEGDREVAIVGGYYLYRVVGEDGKTYRYRSTYCVKCECKKQYQLYHADEEASRRKLLRRYWNDPEHARELKRGSYQRNADKERERAKRNYQKKKNNAVWQQMIAAKRGQQMRLLAA